MSDRLGCTIEAGRSLPDAVARAQLAEKLGYHSIWSSQLPGNRDTSLVLAAYAQATERVHMGTAVLPIYTRHPTAMAQMAQTLDELSGHRFILGLGVSHQVTVEGMWGHKLEHPVKAMREYVEILRSSFREGSASFSGKHFTARWAYAAPRNPDLPIILAALGRHMLELAGELADGVSLFMCSPAYIRDFIVPHVKTGRERAGKSLDGFEITAVVPVCLAADLDRARDAFRQTVATYAGLPFYRRGLDAGGFQDELERGEVSDAMIEQLAGIGDRDAIRAAVDRYRQAGVTLPVAGPMSKAAGAIGVEETLEAAIA